MSAIYQYLGASESDIPMLWLAAPMTGLIVQPIIGLLQRPHLDAARTPAPVFPRRGDPRQPGARRDAQLVGALDGRRVALDP